MLFYFLMLDLDIPYVDFLAIYNPVSLFNFFSISSFSVFFGFATLIDGVFCLLRVLKNGRCGAIVYFYWFMLVFLVEVLVLYAPNNILSVLLWYQAVCLLFVMSIYQYIVLPML